MGLLTTLGHHGDVKVAWKEDDPTDVEKARQTFLDLKTKGFLAFRLADGKRGERIYDFDPKAQEILMVPKVAGGRIKGISTTSQKLPMVYRAIEETTREEDRVPPHPLLRERPRGGFSGRLQVGPSVRLSSDRVRGRSS